MLNKVLSLLDGRKTYLVGTLLVVLGVLQQDHEMIMEGLAFMFLRAGVAKM